MPMSPLDEERHWEEEAGMRKRTGGSPSPNESNWGVAAQLAGFAGAMIPFGHIALPAVILWLKRDESAFIEAHALESLNFQISMTVYLMVGGLLTYVLVGFLLIGFLVLFEVVMVIRAALSASRGELFEYPLSFRLIT
jgi:uncharacterized Tic20 family protein